MLYNKNIKNIQTNENCLNCEFFDKKFKRCKGIGKVCFEYDLPTKTIIDPITKLPLKEIKDAS